MTSTPPPMSSADHPDFADLPRRVDRNAGAELVSKYFFPVASRTLEVWPITWRHVNGKAVCETAELFAVAQAKLDAAPLIPSVRRPTPQTADAA
jgi:hypothetical protein